MNNMTRKGYELDRRDRALRFGSFVWLPSERMLLEGGRPLQIGERALEILMLLLRRAGQVVTKEELIAYAWPNTVVEATTARSQFVDGHETRDLHQARLLLESLS